MPDDPQEPDPIAELRAQIRATRDAAEQLAGEAASARSAWESGGAPQGFATAGEHRQRTDEVQALAGLLQSLRDLIPADLEEQFRELVRQVLLLVRALIDWWVARIEAPPPAEGPAAAGPSDVQDIPIS